MIITFKQNLLCLLEPALLRLISVMPHYFDFFIVFTVLTMWSTLCSEISERNERKLLDLISALKMEEQIYFRETGKNPYLTTSVKHRFSTFFPWYNRRMEDLFTITYVTRKRSRFLPTFMPTYFGRMHSLMKQFTYNPRENYTLIVYPFGGLTVKTSPWLNISFRERGRHLKRLILYGNLNKPIEDDVNTEYRGYFKKRIVSSTEIVWEFILSIRMEDGDAFHFWIHAVIDKYNFKTPHRFFVVKNGIVV